jgi:hypothetical protein
VKNPDWRLLHLLFGVSLLRRGFNELYMALYMMLTVLNRCVEDAQAKKSQSTETSAEERGSEYSGFSEH